MPVQGWLLVGVTPVCSFYSMTSQDFVCLTRFPADKAKLGSVECTSGLFDWLGPRVDMLFAEYVRILGDPVS